MSSGNGNGAVAVQDTESPGAIMEAVIAKGDLSKLDPGERAQYYRRTCDSMGLNPLTQPFQYITLNGKLTLYATRTATDQLRKINNVTLKVVSEETTVDGLRVVRVRASTPDGREDEEIGAVSVAGLKGDALANGYMKALTKAKRRATLSICGLGWLDETEIETIPASSIRRSPVSSYVPDDEAVIDVAEAEYIAETVDGESGEIVDAPPTASDDIGDQIEQEFLDAIGRAWTPETLQEIAGRLRESGISTQALRDAYKVRSQQIAAHPLTQQRQAQTQPELVSVPAPERPIDERIPL